jgi:organic hydroperoxide reductase OsmC/OhrA
MSSNEKVFTTRLERVRDYRFRVKFDSPSMPDILMDESEPLGKGEGPNASRLLSAAVGNCLSASLLFCLSKARVDVGNLETSVETVTRRNEKGRWRITELRVKLSPSVKEDDVERSKRCMDLFEDFCVVTQSVRNGIRVTVGVETRPSESAS